MRSMALNFAIIILIIIIFQVDRHSVYVLNVSIYVYLNICPMPFSAVQIIINAQA